MKGYIYKLTSPNTDMIYIGSTTRELKERLKCHRNDALNPSRLKISSSIMFEYGDVSIHLIREVECDNIRIEEQFELDNYDGEVCNQKRAYCSAETAKVSKNKQRKTYDKEYRIANKQYNKEYQYDYKRTEKYKLYARHFNYWSRGPGKRTLSILKPLFYDIQ